MAFPREFQGTRVLVTTAEASWYPFVEMVDESRGRVFFFFNVVFLLMCSSLLFSKVVFLKLNRNCSDHF